MAQTIIIEENFQHWVAPCRITISYIDVWVQFDGRPAVQLYWDELANVEVLSEAFGTLPVRVFKQLVPVLGAISAQQEHYMVLM